ncbi:MAG TPA: DUF4230 domain-containing protein [Acidimicrobiales bacterium]
MPTMPTTPGRVAKGHIGRIFGVIGAVVFVGGALVVALTLVTGISALNPFHSTTTERHDGVVLAKISDLSRFEAATGRFETIVDQQTSSKLPSWATGERVVLDAQGDVTASVDLSKLPADAITLSADGKSATVHVPAPTLDAPRLDPATTRVVARERGVVDRVGDALSGSDPTNDQALYQRAAEKLSAAASQSDLKDRARANTERFLHDTLASAGVTQVTVVFDQDAAATR